MILLFLEAKVSSRTSLFLNISLINSVELFLLVLHSFFYHLIKKLFGVFLFREGEKKICKKFTATSANTTVFTIPGCHWHPGWMPDGEVLSAPFLPAATTAHTALRHGAGSPRTGPLLWQTTKCLVKCGGFVLFTNPVSCQCLRVFFSLGIFFFFIAIALFSLKKMQAGTSTMVYCCPPSSPVLDTGST